MGDVPCVSRSVTTQLGVELVRVSVDIRGFGTVGERRFTMVDISFERPGGPVRDRAWQGSVGTRRRSRLKGALRRVLSAAVLVGVTGAPVVAGAPASAAPVYEITGRWADGTPSTVQSGGVVNAEWRVNVNDDAEAPSNDPVADVTFTATLGGGTFAGLPDACLVDEVTPASSISADGLTLTCNLGTHDQGTAIVVQTAINADGPTGSQLTASGAIDGATADLDPIDIVNEFGMDIAWGSAVRGVQTDGTFVNVPFQWTLFHARGSDPGPDSVSYLLDVATGTGAAVSVAPTACAAFTGAGGSAAGHPWSGGSHPADQLAPFVDSCTLVATATPGRFRLTLTGIDYSATQVPTKDSAGLPLPTDRIAVASGTVVVRVNSTADNSITLASNAPTYTAPSGATATDDASNNTSSKTWVTGGWSSAWQPEGTGYSTPSWWSDQFRVAAGSAVQAVNNVSWGQGASPDAEEYAQCIVLDTRYVTYDSTAHTYGWGGDPVASTFEWYVGNAATLNPASAGYDPNAFRCANDPAGWTTTEPADKSTVKAVRVTYPFSAIRGAGAAPLTVRQTVKPGVAPGQDVWMFGEVAHNGTWAWVNRSMDPGDAGAALRTPNTRYPFVSNGRDILRIIGVSPALEKSVDRSLLQPGEPATYTLTYSANGTGNVPTSVDDFRVTDTLPVGLSYVPGSAAPEPGISTSATGEQVLTWELDGVTTNVQHALTYQAIADPSVEPGQVLRNSANASYGGATSSRSSADVTLATNGHTTIGKSADTPVIPNVAGDGVGEGSWTVTLRSLDPLPQAFTDTIDILPYVGDGRGTAFTGGYVLTGVDAVPGATVYYTDADPATLSDDPAEASNGSAGDVAGNTVGWSTTIPANVTAVRVIGPELAPGGTQQFTVGITTDGVVGGDVLVNRAQGRDGHTELLMRTSAAIVVANYYSASLKKYVQDSDGEWHDANTVEDYPTFFAGDTVPYRIVVANTGQGTLTNVVVDDDRYPAEGGFTVASLAPGESSTHEFTITLADDASGTLVNTASASADVPADSETPPTINIDPAGIEIHPEHQMQVEKLGESTDGTWVRMDGSGFELLEDVAGQPGDVLAAPVPTEIELGLFQVSGIQAGTYWLQETAAPDGFNLLAQAVQFTVHPDGTVTIDANGGDVVTAAGSLITVRDVPAMELPESGGTGTLPFRSAGIALLTLALALAWLPRSRSSTSKEAELGD